MLLRYFYDRELAQASYLIGCPDSGEALVIDPSRQIAPYLQTAKEEDLQIRHITETHIHADFVSGSRELAAATGARLYLSDMGDADWKYGFSDPHTILIHDGDSWMVGNVRVEVIHTPGHTPEHVVFRVTDTAGANEPIGIFTGDFIFVGDVGRPDLLEEAAGYIGTREIGAHQQYHSLQAFKEMPDYLQIWPGHGAGSACGKSLGAIPSTTLGYEKRFNPAFQIQEEASFMAWLLEGQPEAPRYFAQMKRVNKAGPTLLNTLPAVPHLDATELDQVLSQGHWVMDYRNRRDFVRGHRLGTISIPATSSNFLTYTGWYVDYDQPLYFITYQAKDAAFIIEKLRSIGVDNIGGYFTPEAIGVHPATLPTIKMAELRQRLTSDNPLVLDVRGASEFAEGHIADSLHMPLGYVLDHLDELPRDRLIVTQCRTGYRAQLVASLLRRQGFENVVSLDDKIKNWSPLVVE
jgi:hydroxyacylglutathione hydrolase